jgi:hypothetical protein
MKNLTLLSEDVVCLFDLISTHSSEASFDNQPKGNPDPEDEFISSHFAVNSLITDGDEMILIQTRHAFTFRFFLCRISVMTCSSNIMHVLHFSFVE